VLTLRTAPLIISSLYHWYSHSYSLLTGKVLKFRHNLPVNENNIFLARLKHFMPLLYIICTNKCTYTYNNLLKPTGHVMHQQV